MKINLNNLYIVNLVMLEGYSNGSAYASPFKSTVVYRSKLGNFYDLSTRKKYPLFCDIDPFIHRIGKIFADQSTLVPLTKVMSFEEDKMSKSKVLQKIKNIDFQY